METLEKGRRWAWEGSPEKVKGGATPRGSVWGAGQPFGAAGRQIPQTATRGGEGRPATLRLVSDSGCSSSGVGEGVARDPGVAVSQKMAPEGSEAWPCW